MDFFIRDDNVRPGNRGGRDQFKWDDIRMMNNKERESYLGVSQSIGFLDKGGKWRKRDWWQNYQPERAKDKDIQAEKTRIQMEEKQMLKDAIYGNSKKDNEQNKKLTDFQFDKLMKKESKLNPNDAQLFDFYDDDQKRAGLGMKSVVSFRTNPYDKTISLSKLEGNHNEEIVNNTIIKGNNNDNSSSNNLGVKDKSNAKESKLKKYIHEYVHRNKHHSLSRSRSNSNLIKENKTKHHKQSKRQDETNEKDNKRHHKDKNSHKHKHKHKHSHRGISSSSDNTS